jgi:kumamolisin
MFALTLLGIPSPAQTAPSNGSPGTGRVAFDRSIKEVASTQSESIPNLARLVRSELAPAEVQETLDFSVALKMHNFAELQERIANRETIPLDEIATKYYPTAEEYQKVAEWLTSQGFAVKPASKYNLSVFASGPVAQIERAFGTKFGRVSFQGVDYTSALVTPSLPSAVAPPVLGINGLQPHLHPRRHFNAIPLMGFQKLLSTGNQPPYTVPEIAKAYGANGLSVNGAGQTIGIVIDTFPANSDLAQFWIANAISQSLSNIERVQVVPGVLPLPSGEETLDVEWSSGIAPGAKVRVYATMTLSTVNLDKAYQAIINDLPSQPGLHQVSLSYGAGETYMPPTQMQTDDQYFAMLAAAGVTVFVSSGDGGSTPGPNGYGDTSGPVQVESPANDPNVTAVGGTSLLLDASTGIPTSESAWSLGGGGKSTIFTRPTWQIGSSLPAGVTRLVPDVALDADINTGGYLYLNGQEYIVGGTSWGAPTWAGFSATINQALSNAGKSPLGLLGPKIYPLIGTGNFRDVTKGTNGTYSAGVGYDLTTGVGVPNLAAFLATISPPKTSIGRSIAKDFNGDGFADLVWQNTATGEHAIWFLKNGAYSSSATLATLPVAWRIAGVGDFNNDGFADLAWENTITGQGAVWFLKNGVPSGSVNLPTLPQSWVIAGVGDFDGDGFADLVLENTVTGQTAIWLLKNGVFSSGLSLPTEALAWHIVGVGDFNGDGLADLVWENTLTGQCGIWFLKSGVLSSTLTLPTLPLAWHIAGAGDFSGDGFADLALQNSITGQCAIWLLKNGVYSSSLNLPTMPLVWHIANH